MHQEFDFIPFFLESSLETTQPGLEFFKTGNRAQMSDRLIYESRKSKVFYRTDESGAAFAVKVLNFEFPTPDDISQFHNEFDIIEGLHLAGVRNAIKKTRENGRHVLIMEWIKGQPLKEAFRDKTGDIVDALHIAIAASNTLAEIHENQIIHRDVILPQ
jgi:histidine kinase